jgi:Cu-processing system permease protein
VLGLWEALVAAQALGFGAAGLVIYNQAGEEGLGAFLALFGASALLTAIFLGLAAVVSAGSMGRRRSRALALALVTWFVAVVLFDLAVLGAATWLPSGYASRLLVSSVLVNPVDATRTGTLLLVEGAAAFGAASLAFLRFTKGTTGAAILITASLALWLCVPLAWASWKLKRVDL